MVSKYNRSLIWIEIYLANIVYEFNREIAQRTNTETSLCDEMKLTIER